jgi:hypothetical protein
MAQHDCESGPLLAALIDPHLTAALGHLPGCIRSEKPCRQVLHEHEQAELPPPPPFNLAFATLKRGLDLGLASAQQAMNCTDDALCGEHLRRLTPDELRTSRNPCVGEVLTRLPELIDATPLWYYVLREAEALQCGRRLGPFGSRVVMETVHAALEASTDSILADLDWRPTLPSQQAGNFTMGDLIAFTGNADPFGAYMREALVSRGGLDG